MPAIEFWTTVHKYKDPSDANPTQDIAAAAVKLLVLPLSNAEAERVFWAVTLTKTDFRNRMGHELLVAILIKFALRMRGVTSAEFQVPREMVEKVNYDIYQ
ncbi:hypothetical protein HPB48_016488 [Haemaphysalis longicornis]|uniref:HAT C-terminal dimerisation domain-containing protein n=1 Tax=Haemaphysalis longicornis TaxID=44386 RepID=A0A9J6FY52_HAELO|nr:hypothetical protein HPB48_016488 [Haemaphysalis longicornis]